MSRPSMYLLDGHWLIYRCYYAPFRPLSSPTGEPTKATFVFFSQLLSLLRQRRPAHVVMCMDVSDETVFRVAIAPDYKSNRPPPPEDLAPQKERIMSILTSLGIPILRVPGFEADDIMATLARRHGGVDYDVYLVSKDKDLDQLLRNGVKLYDPQDDSETDAANMEAKKGYPPSKAVDAQTLMGDSVDAVKGVEGIGPKRAAELLAKYGDVAGIIANADKLTPKLKASVIEFAPRADIVRQLVTLRDDVPVEFDGVASSPLRYDYTAARDAFAALGFSRLQDQIDTVARQYGITPAERTQPANIPLAPEPAAPQVALPVAEVSASTLIAPGTDAGDSIGVAPAPRAPVAPPTQAKRKNRPPAATSAGLFDHLEQSPISPQGPTASAAPVGATLVLDERLSSGQYVLVDTEPALTELASKLRTVSEFAFDTETTSLTPAEADIVGLSFSWEAGRAYYVAVRGSGRTLAENIVRDVLSPIFADERIGKCGQNVKYDIGVLLTAGMPVRGVRFDTMIASFLLDGSRRSHGIDALAADLLGIRKIATSELIGSGKEQLRFDQLDTARVAAYACEDADVAWRLKELLSPRIEAAGLSSLFHDLEVPLAGVLAIMEHNGITLDTAPLAALSNELAQRMQALTRAIHQAAGREFNVNSIKQLADVLFDELKLPVLKRTRTTRSTDADVLDDLSRQTGHAVPRLVLEYRELAKLKGTYVDVLPDMVCQRTGRVHCSFHQAVAVTGRLASSDPNLQNIPIRTDLGAQVRRAFVPRAALLNVDRDALAHASAAAGGSEAWTLISADYSQIELRVLAHFCGDEHLRQAFMDDLDIHAFVASQVFHIPIGEVTKEQRARAKTVNFGIVYGQTAFGLARQTGMTQTEAKDFIAAYFARYPRIREFLDATVKQARVSGSVATMLGRRREIADLHSQNPQARAQAERFAINTVVQGSAADIIKRAMINIQRRIDADNLPLRMLLQVHDELVFETPTSALMPHVELVRKQMSEAIPLSVPMRVDVGAGPNWLDVADL